MLTLVIFCDEKANHYFLMSNKRDRVRDGDRNCGWTYIGYVRICMCLIGFMPSWGMHISLCSFLFLLLVYENMMAKHQKLGMFYGHNNHSFKCTTCRGLYSQAELNLVCALCVCPCLNQFFVIMVEY